MIIDDKNQYVYSEDIRISIRRSDYGLTSEDSKDCFSTYHDNWINNYPNKKAYTCIFNLCLNGEIIEKFYTVLVDGGRCYIPHPETKTMEITEEQYLIASILHNNHKKRIDYLDDYLKIAGITVKK